jgi:thymidylate synthase ThyX
MKVTHVAIRPTEASIRQGRPSLTPELLAASGARYSRKNEGLQSILDRIDPDHLDASVDSIFRMIDYGHQSIADMVPVAMFIDRISIWLAYYLWTLCPLAGGQESSTRYIKLGSEGLLRPDELGIPRDMQSRWSEAMDRGFDAYKKALTIWDSIASQDPSVIKLPPEVAQDKSDKGKQRLARMQRNYAFDRARSFLPVAAGTNVMMVMSARAWVLLCQYLLSAAQVEQVNLGKLIREELELAAPRLCKYAQETPSIKLGLDQDFGKLRHLASLDFPTELMRNASSCEAPDTACLTTDRPAAVSPADFASALALHDNRYAWIGKDIQRISVRFGWNAVSFAEIRDLNRHRTGTKYCPIVPKGFYFSREQVPMGEIFSGYREHLVELSGVGRDLSSQALNLLRDGDKAYPYWMLLGTQYSFEHLTTGDKFIYEVELRTGAGAHFRYAKHLRDAAQLWYAEFPETQGLILEGSAEPE